MAPTPSRRTRLHPTVGAPAILRGIIAGMYAALGIFLLIRPETLTLPKLQVQIAGGMLVAFGMYRLYSSYRKFYSPQRDDPR